MTLNIPLMHNNITKEDRKALIKFLQKDVILTQSEQVAAFEEEWSKWLGVKYSVFVNSGASANLLTMKVAARHKGNQVILSPLNWVSDIASVIQNDFNPKFVDIDKKTLGMDENQTVSAINKHTNCVFVTHILGLPAITKRMLQGMSTRDTILIEDVCESHGATFNGKKLGTYGWMSNFSFYYAHHMTTIEGGMICTDDVEAYNRLRSYRSHGLLREQKDDNEKRRYMVRYPDLNPDFIFINHAYNVRNNELGAVLGRNQLKRLDENNEKRKKNFKLFLEHLDPKQFQVDFDTEESCNYAFILVLKKKDKSKAEILELNMKNAKVEFRRGLSGGGNQLRQPYLRALDSWEKYPNTEHVHFFGWYIGNYPDLERKKILALCDLLNQA